MLIPLKTQSKMSPSLRRLFQLGPLAGIFILMCAALTTLHFFVQLFFPINGVICFVHFVVVIVFCMAILHCFISTVMEDPGQVPQGWRPSKAEDEYLLEYCRHCEAFKAPRAHHCSRCGRCILKMDHHCNWLGGCVGYRNQRSFFCTVLLSVIGSVYSFVLLFEVMHRVVNSIPNEQNKHIYLSLRGLFFVLFTMAMDLVGMIGFGPLLYQQMRGLVRNQTLIEELIVAKVKARNESFIFPYNLGILINIAQVLLLPLDDGIKWPVARNCTQYSLTQEQVALKAAKWHNAKLHEIVAKYNGHYWPLFSQGLGVCLLFPKNAQPRLPVEPNDHILVRETAGWGRWMYGRKVDSKLQEEGWFPAKCAHPLIESMEEEDAKSELNDNSRTYEAENNKKDK